MSHRAAHSTSAPNANSHQSSSDTWERSSEGSSVGGDSGDGGGGGGGDGGGGGGDGGDDGGDGGGGDGGGGTDGGDGGDGGGAGGTRHFSATASSTSWNWDSLMPPASVSGSVWVAPHIMQIRRHEVDERLPNQRLAREREESPAV